MVKAELEYFQNSEIFKLSRLSHMLCTLQVHVPVLYANMQIQTCHIYVHTVIVHLPYSTICLQKDLYRCVYMYLDVEGSGWIT